MTTAELNTLIREYESRFTDSLRSRCPASFNEAYRCLRKIVEAKPNGCAAHHLSVAKRYLSYFDKATTATEGDVLHLARHLEEAANPYRQRP